MACVLFACQSEEDWGNPGLAPTGDCTLSFVTGGMMDQYNVTTRGDIKEPEEQEIKSLHVFIFDEDGNYLEAKDAHRYQGYRNIPDGKTVMNIDREGWANPTKAEKATIVVVGNVEEGTFQFSSGDVPPENVPNLEALERFVYKPLVSGTVTQLPESGMPMYAREDNINLTNTNTNKRIEIPMKALLARVDVSIQLDSKNTDETGALPSLTLTKCEVLNIPRSTALVENTDPASETDLETFGKESPAWQPELNTIYNKQGKVEFTFYTFENRQKPANPNYQYPADITEDQKQRYKPELADKDNSLAFRFTGIYRTYNNATYEATYTLYLGKNHTNDFEVWRNKQYKNNITIKGIVDAGNNPEHITFDARVNVTESNPYFISILKDKEMDSHFNVVPMDIYLFDTEKNPSVTVEIVESEKNSWIRLERIPAENMENGTLPTTGIAPGGPELLAMGGWHSGHGKRKYFTTDLVTNTLQDNVKYENVRHRDRIYLYVDENLDVWHLNTNEEKTREATLKISYYENGTLKNDRTLTIEQAKLLEVTFHSDEESGFSNKTIYIEAYEEYLNHGDPLDEYGDEQVYTGLPWGADGVRISDYDNGTPWWILDDITAYENYYWGQAFTSKIVNEGEMDVRNITLNTKPLTAAGYCYIKNKRNSDGSVPSPKWYLPGIRELERILEDYYLDYTEFQNNYYWSSAAGNNRRNNGQLTEKARATKAYIGEDSKFHYYESGEDYPYDGENGNGGSTYRTQSLRIRAARIDANPQ